MSNTKISELPQFTDNPKNTWLILNNSGETETLKVLREDFLNGYIVNNITGQTINTDLTIGGTNDFTDGILKIHQPSDNPWSFFLFNDTYDNTAPAFGGFVWNNGDVAIGTETNTQFEVYTNANYEEPVITVSGTNVNVIGDLTIKGNLIVTGNSVVSDIGVYRALLTQTGSLTGTSLLDFNFSLIQGETYEITNYAAGDDFSNIADVVAGTINETGCVFVATGEIPIIYSNGSELVSSGDLIVDVLDNTLGFGVNWEWNSGVPGFYIGSNNIFGPVENSFPRNKVDSKIQLSNISFYSGSPFVSLSITPYSFVVKDDLILINVYDTLIDDSVNNALYYTPIEIKINKNNTPIITSGTVVDSFPFINVSVRIFCEGNLVNSYYTNNGDPVYDMSELFDRLNNESGTNILGTFSDDGAEGIQLTMTTDVKNYFCENRNLTFEIFAD